MIDFNDPVLSDKQRADAIFHATDYRSSDYCFGNLFIWRKKSGIKIAFHKGFVIVRFEIKCKTMYLYPAGIGDRAEALRDMEQDARQNGKPFIMASINPVMRIELDLLFPGKFDYAPNRNSYDYVYNMEDMRDLSGKKYHSKRNHITRFKATGDWCYEDINAANIQDCAEMNDQWCIENGCNQEQGLRDEYCAVKQAIVSFDALGLLGGLLRLYGKVVAFTIGERLCLDTFDVHIEKAFSRVEGAYPTINNEFISHNCGSYRYINREEDTGDVGLRKAKLSYQPAILLQKDIASLKDGATL